MTLIVAVELNDEGRAYIETLSKSLGPYVRVSENRVKWDDVRCHFDSLVSDWWELEHILTVGVYESVNDVQSVR